MTKTGAYRAAHDPAGLGLGEPRARGTNAQLGVKGQWASSHLATGPCRVHWHGFMPNARFLHMISAASLLCMPKVVFIHMPKVVFIHTQFGI